MGYLDKVRAENARLAKNAPKRKIKRNKGGLARKSKSPIRKIQDSLWQECRRIIKARYGNTCYTCKKHPLEGANYQVGHFIPSSVGGALLRYHLNNLRPQCFRCNINLSGNGAVFYRLLVEQEGQQYVDDLFALKQQTTKALDHYELLLQQYREVK